ncbi:MAG: hypothetical protein IJZ13_05590, partial [Clostridia bacterium]|nr:hypothetical protein [Clostridia bacterium]
ILFSNISAMTYGKDPFTAVNKMETVEMYAQMTSEMRRINGLQFDEATVRDFISRRAVKYAAAHPKHLCVREKNGEIGCHTCKGGCIAKESTPEELIPELVARVLKELGK